VASVTAANNQLVAKMSHLIKEHSIMEKRLTQTMLNLEVADASNRTLLHEIQEARTTITRLSAQTAKAVGWEAKVFSLQQERDDLREERKAEASRAKGAEAKAAALTEKCGKHVLLQKSIKFLNHIF
jgi:YesN/AraC family two-component response regulator